MESQAIPNQRVFDHGEVFTGKREVNAMLDMVKQETEWIDSRFREPACRNDNSLAEILKRKLRLVERRYGKSQLPPKLPAGSRQCKLRLSIADHPAIVTRNRPHRGRGWCVDPAGPIMCCGIYCGGRRSIQFPLIFNGPTCIAFNLLERDEGGASFVFPARQRSRIAGRSDAAVR